jgi:hypothetical protein
LKSIYGDAANFAAVEIKVRSPLMEQERLHERVGALRSYNRAAGEVGESRGTIAASAPDSSANKLTVDAEESMPSSDVDALSAARESPPSAPPADAPALAEAAIADRVPPNSKPQERGLRRGKARYLSPDAAKGDLESLTWAPGQFEGQTPEMKLRSRAAQDGAPVRVLFVLEESRSEPAAPATKAAEPTAPPR